MSAALPLVVFSHLRWDWVHQRPQHLLTRIAQRRPVIVIEEPVHEPGARSRWQATRPAANVAVYRPVVPSDGPGFADAHRATVEPMVRELVAQVAPAGYDLWFYTPMAVPFAAGLAPRVTVYDCMDELSAFAHAPPELLDRERKLLEQADLVFTGGPSLYRAKKDRHPSVHCFPSSVDARHFRQARQPMTEPAVQAALPRPRLGYFGVIDERFDVPLLTYLADARPDWQFVMVGPVVKIDPASLPQRPNVVYAGQQQYADLPAFLSGWDVALLPFARNEATRFISPTKTLEYFAAEKPTVSTPIADVADPYGDIVYLGDTPAAFLAACERALTAPAAERDERTAGMRSVLARTSWDATAAAVADLIERAADAPVPPGPAPAVKPTPPVVVIGAGPTGLSAAYHLGDDALLLDANDRVGGWCRSVQAGGFTFDFAGHIMFSTDPYVHELYEMLLGDNVHWQDREAWVYSKGVHTRYPFQGALYGLPAEVIAECIVGAAEARYGGPKRPGLNGSANGHGHANGHANGNGKACHPVVNDKGDSLTDCCGDGVSEATAPLVKDRRGEPRNFEEFIYQVWGAGIAKHFAVPYNRKIWAVPLAEMETSWLGGRVPMPDLQEMVVGAVAPKPKPMGPNARFGYPLRGGFQALMDGFLPHLRGPVRLNSRVAQVSPSRRTVTLTTGEQFKYERLISTMPLPLLVKAMGDEAPADVRRAAAGLRHTSVRCVNLGVGRERLTDKHWVYYPEDTVFHRIFVQGNASPHCNPPGGFGLTCEITYGPLKPLPCDGDALIRRCIAECVAVGMMRPDDPVWVANQVDMPCAYVVYDHARKANVDLVREWLAARGIVLSGRYSEWEYYNSDHAFLAGKKAAEQARDRRPARAAVAATV